MDVSHTYAMVLLAQQEGGGLAGLPLLILFGLIFYMLLIRPQQRQVRRQRELVGSVKQGDRIVAAGGIVGTIRRIDDDTISLQVADNVVLKIDRSSVSRKLEA